MKHTKLLFFNILLCSAPAMQAMGSVRSFGARAFKAASASAAKFKMNAQAFKAKKQPFVKPFGFKNGKQSGYKNYAHTAATMPLMSTYYLYAAYDRLKITLGYEPSINQYTIEHFPEFKNQFVKLALEQQLPAASVRALMLKYPEHAEQIATRQFVLAHAACPDIDLETIIKEQGLEEPVEHLAILKRLQAQMGIVQNMRVVADPKYSITLQFPSSKTPALFISINPAAPYTKRAWEFGLAHELTHVLKHHAEQLYFMNTSTIEGSAQSRSFEYEADEGAALTLGSIDGGMEFLRAIPDTSSHSGWKVPAEYTYSNSDGSIMIHLNDSLTHPSDASRCRALLALKEKYPEKFKKTIELSVELVNDTINLCNA